ncbi:hypothetical protein [Kitasatospora sp. NPDC094015]|uniref:hypothetical protein n=1 Tax=Kitasatospora sp. NPDC094015 TaxID=3155205 RepID=UPI00331C818A
MARPISVSLPPAGAGPDGSKHLIGAAPALLFSPSPAPAPAPAPGQTAEPPGADWGTTLLDMAATARPVPEVGVLLDLLETSDTAVLARALNSAARNRPVEELADLIVALAGAPNAIAHEALRIAVVTREVPEVARLVDLLGADPDSGVREALCAAALERPVAEVAQLARCLNRPEPRTPEPLTGAETAAADGTATPESPAAPETGPGSTGGAEPVVAARPVTASGARRIARRLRSPLRRPAAVALLTAAAAHLPLVLPYWRTAPYLGAAAAVLVGLFLLLAVRLVRRDTALVWCSTAAVGAVAVAGYFLTHRYLLPAAATELARWQDRLGPLALAAELVTVLLAAALCVPRLRQQGPVRPGPRRSA